MMPYIIKQRVKAQNEKITVTIFNPCNVTIKHFKICLCLRNTKVGNSKYFTLTPKYGVFWRPIDQDQVLTTWSEGRQNGLVLNLRLCDVTALQASKSDINIQ